MCSLLGREGLHLAETHKQVKWLWDCVPPSAPSSRILPLLFIFSTPQYLSAFSAAEYLFPFLTPLSCLSVAKACFRSRTLPTERFWHLCMPIVVHFVIIIFTLWLVIWMNPLSCRTSFFCGHNLIKWIYLFGQNLIKWIYLFGQKLMTFPWLAKSFDIFFCEHLFCAINHQS